MIEGCEDVQRTMALRDIELNGLFDVNNWLNAIPKIYVWRENVGNSFKSGTKAGKKVSRQ